MLNIKWFKREAVKETKVNPDSPKYKDQGQKEKLLVNPKPNAFEPNVSQPKDTSLGDKYKSKGENIPAAKVGPYKKSAAEVNPNAPQYKDTGIKEKLQYPTSNPTVSVKQPGTTSDNSAASKKYKDPGQKEKLIINPGKAKEPKIPASITTDNSTANKYWTNFQKEKISPNPKPGTFEPSVSQPKATNKVPRTGEEKVKPFQKQFSLNWFKKDAKNLDQARKEKQEAERSGKKAEIKEVRPGDYEVVTKE